MSVPLPATASAPTPSCYAHPDVRHTGRCDRCERPICETCAFRTASGRFCPDCMIDGSAADQRHTSAVLPIVSLACAAGVVFCLLLVFRYIGDGTSGGAASGFGMLLVLVGITTGLLGRDHGRRTGSPLSLIAVIANGVLLGIFGLLIVIGLTKHR